MKNLLFHKYYGLLLILLATYWCLLSPNNYLSQWQKIQQKGYVTWVTRPSPLTYYNSLDGIIGLEYEILSQFCKYNDLELRPVIAPSNKILFEKFNTYNVDIAGGNLSSTKERTERYTTTTAYDSTSVRLISSHHVPKIKSLETMGGYSGSVLKNSSYVKIAKILSDKYNTNISSLDNINLYELLQMVADGSIDFTLADSNIISIFKAYIPRLRIGLELSDPMPLVFLLNDDENYSFKIEVDEFIDNFKEQNKIIEYKAFIQKSLPNSKPADTVYFLKNYKKRWPVVKSDIYEVAEKFSLNPILLGAISYQESHWNAKAVSPTLVKGLMMLTKGVAQEQGVTDRFDPRQSLEGGAKHFIKMRKKIPSRISEPDKTSFALASYNLGYGNLEKARVITQQAGESPDLWSDVKLFLPLLNDIKEKKIDGKTAVRYVENIYVYQNLLQWKEQQ